MDVQGQQSLLWPCWPIDIHIITFLLYRQASNQWNPRLAFTLHLYLYWGLCGAVLLRYIKTAAPWSNKQIPPGSAEGYPTSVNNAAFKHQSYAKRLVHRGGDGQQEKAEKQGLDWRDNEHPFNATMSAPTQLYDENISCVAPSTSQHGQANGWTVGWSSPGRNAD